MPIGPAKPVILCTGATLPLAPGANTVIRPATPGTLKFVTKSLLPEPIARSYGKASNVLDPAIVTVGVALPFAPGAYSVTLFPLAFAT
jgi:hypothetical protein